MIEGHLPEKKRQMLHRRESDVPEKILVEWVRYRAHMEEGVFHWFKNSITKMKEKIINRSVYTIAD